MGLALHVSAWLGIPTIATADTNSYCKLMHTMEAGRLPDLRERNIGYPLFMYACKLLPLPLNKALPLAQHVLEVAAAVVVMGWMRRNWGVLAGLLTGVLLLVNSSRAIWSHYAMPNALLCSVVPMAMLVLMGHLAARPRWRFSVACALWLAVMLVRDEVLLLAIVVPLVPLCFCAPWRWKIVKWCGVVLLIAALGAGARQWFNARVVGEGCYSTHTMEVIAWRGLHTPELVAPPRSERLERLYEAALANGARWRDGYLDYEDLWRAGRDKWGMTKREAIKYMVGCAVECIQRRPGAYLGVVMRDTARLWLRPKVSLEWDAFRQSQPSAFERDADRLSWAAHNRTEFPTSYETSAAQRLFHALAVLRPGETFAIKPLVVCFAIGVVCLVFGIGSKRQRFKRSWFVGLAVGVVFMTVFYAALADIPHRYRMSVEWAFFAVASLGLVLPIRALRGKVRSP